MTAHLHSLSAAVDGGDSGGYHSLSTNDMNDDDDDDGDETINHYSSSFLFLFSWFNTHSTKLILFWIVAFCLGTSMAMTFIERAEDRLAAPKGSQAIKDRNRFDQVFPERSSEETMVLYAEADAGQQITCREADCNKKYCTGVNEQVALLFERVGREMTEYRVAMTYLSYYNVTGTKFDQIKCKFASEDGSATFAVFVYNPLVLSKTEVHALLHHANVVLQRELKLYNGPPLVRIGYTGVDLINKAGSDAMEAQLFTVDLFTMPVALFIFTCMVRSPRLLLLCVLNMVMSMVISFGLLGSIVTALGIKPLTVENTFTQALAVAMSIDYSLFMLRRFRDECKNGQSLEEATKITLQQAGEVVLLSCLTFQAVFFGFLFIPSHDLSSLGLCAVVTLMTTLAVNITFTMAMLCTFPQFFSKNIAQQPPPLLEEEEEPTAVVVMPLTTVTGKKRHRRGAPYRGCYFEFMKLITRRPNNYIFVLVVYLCMLPVAWHITRMEHNQNAVQIAPKGAAATKIYNAIIEHFPPGLLGPFSLVVVAPELNFALDKEFYEYVAEVTTAMMVECKLPLESFTSPVSVMGKHIPHALSMQLRNENGLLCKALPNMCAMYKYEWNQAVSPNGAHALLITVELVDNPYSPNGGEFIDNARRVINAMQRPGRFEILLVSTEVDFYADEMAAFAVLPMLLLITVMVVFAIIGCGLRSAFVPLRLSLAVFIPLATVFGIAVLVYQDGALAWTGISAFEKSEDGFFFLIPIICVMVALGLIMDYDIFLVHRIVEHRTSGYDLQASVIKAIWEVNSTINAAGLIMAAVFGGLMLSDEIAVQHFGFLMTCAVLVDTFVVQTFLIPPIVSMGDTFAFWPRQVPQTTLITIEDDEFNT